MNQTIAQTNSNSTGDDNNSNASDYVFHNLGMVLWIVFAAVILMALCSFYVRGYCYDHCGHRECCRGSRTMRERREIFQQRVLAHQAAQRELQRQQQRRDTSRLRSRHEWLKRQLVAYLEPCTVTLKAEDLTKPENGDKEEAIAEVKGAVSVSSLQEDPEMALTPAKQCFSRSSSCLGAELPLGVSMGVDCIFCLRDYVEGDVVVFSPMQIAVSGDNSSRSRHSLGGSDQPQERPQCCPHVHHLACMLEWLCIGKDLCPVCRLRFLPREARTNHGGNRNSAQQQRDTPTRQPNLDNGHPEPDQQANATLAQDVGDEGLHSGTIEADETTTTMPDDVQAEANA